MVHIIPLYKIWVSEDLFEPSFQRGVQSFHFSGVLVQKQALKRSGKNCIFHLFVLVLFASCYY